MNFIVDVEVTRIVHKNEKFQIVGAIPFSNDSNIKLNKYGNITIRDETLSLEQKARYKVELEEQPPTKWGTQYLLVSFPDFTFDDINDITEETEVKLLHEIMSEGLAKVIHDAYPDFVKRILKNEESTIDYSNIKGVGDKKFWSYVDKIKNRCSAILLKNVFPEYDLSPHDCMALYKAYDTLNYVRTVMEKHPYEVLINICGWGFDKTDRFVLKQHPTLRFSQQRIEYMMDTILREVESYGSTYLKAEFMADKVYGIDPEVISYIKNVAIESDIINYDAEKNFLARQATYLCERRVADFIKTRLKYNKKLDWDWQKFNKIKDGELTKEQQNVLKMFCEYNFLILNAASGTGKTSSMMALLEMIESYGMTYRCLSFTGRAASRLATQTGRPASTIHMACMGGFINEDVIIIDEAGMLSLDLIDMVIRANSNPDTRFLLIGDIGQIPPISLGKIMRDSLESNSVPSCTLTKCFRFDEGGASYISALSRKGEFYLTDEQSRQDRVTLGDKQDYTFIKWDGTSKQIVDTYINLVKTGVNPKDICLLTPYNKGDFGTIVLNNMIQEQLNPVMNDDVYTSIKANGVEIKFHTRDLVMNTKNKYDMLTEKGLENLAWEINSDDQDDKTAIFNGQIGKVVKSEGYNETLQTKAFYVDIENEVCVFTPEDARNLLLAYASSVHKYQGSQNKYVINVVIPPHSRMHTKELLYTAQTRMTDKLIEIGEVETMKSAVQKMSSDNKNTRLKEFLMKE